VAVEEEAAASVVSVAAASAAAAPAATGSSLTYKVRFSIKMDFAIQYALRKLKCPHDPKCVFAL
jgi:hypothetical protein